MQIDLEPLDVRHVAPLRQIHQQPGVVRWWGQMEPWFPFDEPESQRYAIVVDGQVAGLIQHGEEDWPGKRHAYIDIFLGDDHAGRGIGTEALRRLVDRLARDYEHIVIDPRADNEAAIRCYEKVGFERLADWRGDLLMQIVVERPLP